MWVGFLMSNSFSTHFVKKSSTPKVARGFTLIELMVGVAMVGIITAIAIPNLGQFLIKMRVDNQVSEIQRLILTTRNTAINMGVTTTLCPLSNTNTCTQNWQNQLSVFIDLNNNAILELALGDQLIKVKAAINPGDNLQYSNNNPVTYRPTGLISTINGNFSYCPETQAALNRGITISPSGRASVSSDLDNDDIDEFIGFPPTPIVCAGPPP